ncbi:SCO1664 family protein [Mycolicibacterium sp.]|uniref:SCO1664 family protein n=1 Tax=Mycolicibacterium sp. TaxID=2320850 RepID=UPI001A1DA19D|nr:SCO1664 family protein [Mycolicibacterium sp.]MBJ7401291.1 SCO1664 family protein [Mycolicibacterium sp.]
MTDTDERHETLRSGELKILGRIRSASNATFLCEAQRGDDTVHCVYKPVAGEQPLWDFPDGTLAGREYGAFAISAALGWNIVPHTIIRDGPAGTGMLQLWIEQPDDDNEDQPSGPDLVDLCPVDAVPAGYLSAVRAYDYTGEEVRLVHADNLRLRQMAVFDVIVNNADRKGGHILNGLDGQVYGVDHGLALHVQDKLRTVLWGWAGKPIDNQTQTDLTNLEKTLGSALGSELREHITAAELAALRRRVRALLDDPVMPSPERSRPLPWPAF